MDFDPSRGPLLDKGAEHDKKGDLTGTNDLPKVRVFTWGIFQVAYDVPALLSLPSPSTVAQFFKLVQPVFRFMGDLWHIAAWHSTLYYACVLWMTLAPAVSLFLAAMVVFNIEALTIRPQAPGDIIKDIRVYAISWLFCGFMTYHAEGNLVNLRVRIGGSLRSHFIPSIVKSCLQWDVNDLNSSYGYFPYAHDYEDLIPGWDAFGEILFRLHHNLVLMIQPLSLIYILSVFNPTFNRNLLVGLTACFYLITFFAPRNGLGGAGYTFWTTNENYKRLMVLFNIVFDHKYRLTLVKDSLVGYITEEYKRVSDALGIAKTDTWILACNIPPPFYWAVPQFWITDYSMALIALFIPLPASISMIANLALIQYAISAVKEDFEYLKRVNGKGGFMDLLSKVKTFYSVLDKSVNQPEKLQYPLKNIKGAEIIFDGVSFKYPDSETNALENVDLHIRPGQLVVISGTNGSGKTSFMKLVSGLLQPTKGRIIVDGIDLSKYDIEQFRQASTYVAQSETIYPISLEENLLMGLTNQSLRDSVSPEDLENAARLGGSYELIKKLGYDTILNPISRTCYSVYEKPGKGALEMYKNNTTDLRPREISSGEYQRLIASRAFLRLNMSPTKVKLIILDEPTNALDTVAENGIFNQFIKKAKEGGQTLIVVTHRLASVAKHADVILCLKNGRIVEQGTHSQLIEKADGRYSALFKVQTLIE